MGKNERITCRPPKDRDQAGNAETLCQHGKDVLRADKATIKKRQARQRHEKDQRGARHHPCIMAGTRARDVRRHWQAGIGAARRIIYIGFEIGYALLERR